VEKKKLETKRLVGPSITKVKLQALKDQHTTLFFLLYNSVAMWDSVPIDALWRIKKVLIIARLLKRVWKGNIKFSVLFQGSEEIHHNNYTTFS